MSNNESVARSSQAGSQTVGFDAPREAIPLTTELQTAVDAEVNVLDQVLSSLRSQRAHAYDRLATESVRAQALTSELVATRRDEEKAMLASDEAVSHKMRDQGKDNITILNRLIDKPYFARLVVKEDIEGSGANAPISTREYEYRLGLAANPDCRIIDWRRAPISKLYYEYKEGDFYSEEIQGRERNGEVILRNGVEITKSVLRKVTCRHGTAIRVAGMTADSAPTWRTASDRRSTERSGGRLPSVLALITPDQFRTITEGATTAVLIQGIAGSGKTTVALHRLAWLLHEDNSPALPEECVVVVLSPVLKRYIELSLEALEIRGVPVVTFAEWASPNIAALAADLFDQSEPGSTKTLLPRRPSEPLPHSIDRLKRSMGMLRAVETLAQKRSIATLVEFDAEKFLIEVLDQPQLIEQFDDSKLLDRELIARGRERAIKNYQERVLDRCDDGLLVRIHQLRHEDQFLVPHVASGLSARSGSYRQIVVDEVQEFGSPELASLVSSVEELSGLTIVGDVNQRMSSKSFPGWEKLRQHWDLSHSMSRFLSLTVSHRSTLEIMNLAHHVIDARNELTGGRRGRPPIWFHARREDQGIPAAIKWLNTAIERYPSAVTAVICRDSTEAKHVLTLLRPTFGSAVRLGDEDAFSFEDGILVSDVHSVKGLEFTNVLIWNPSVTSYGQSEENRNSLYVAITRAEENLCIASWGRPSTYLPAPNSAIAGKLVRVYDLRVEEDEEQ